MSNTAEMRSWLKDLDWNDVDADEQIDDATDDEIRRIINNTYDGGLEAFERESSCFRWS